MKMKKINGNEELLHAFGEMLGEVLEAKLEEKLGPKLEEVLEAKLEEKLEEVLEAKLEEKLEAKLEEKLEAKLEEKLEAKFEEKLGPIRNRLTNVERKLGQMEENFGSRLTNIELTLENDVDYKLQLMLEIAEDVPLHSKQLRDHEHRIGTLERFRP